MIRIESILSLYSQKKNTNTIFAIRSHGSYLMQDGKLVSTQLKLNDSETDIVVYDSKAHMSNLDLKNLDLAMFIGCTTAYGGTSGPNLASVAVKQGAQTAVGFSKEINCSIANNWTMQFFQYIEEGYSVQAACKKLAGNSTYGATTLGTSYIICGYKSLVLN